MEVFVKQDRSGSATGDVEYPMGQFAETGTVTQKHRRLGTTEKLMHVGEVMKENHRHAVQRL